MPLRKDSNGHGHFTSLLRESREEQEQRNANYWNQQLDEDNFHEIVNEDDQMYDDIDAVPVDGDTWSIRFLP